MAWLMALSRIYLLVYVLATAIHIQAQITKTMGLWTQISSGSLFPARVYHSSVFDPTSKLIYTFFGTNRSLTIGSQSYTDIWTFNITNNAWNLVTPSSGISLIPHIHDHSTAIDLKHRIAYTYGGFKGGGGYGPAYNSNKLYSFNMVTAAWQLITPLGSTAPPVLRMHSSNFDSNIGILYIIGGNTGSNSGFLQNKVWAYNVTSVQWSLVVAKNQGFSQRSGHSSVLDASGNIYVIAGLNGTSSAAPTNYMNDIWMLNMTSKLWTQLSYAPAGFGLRANHKSVFDQSSNTIFSTGGLTSGTYVWNDIWAFSLTSSKSTLVLLRLCFQYILTCFEIF